MQRQERIARAQYDEDPDTFNKPELMDELCIACKCRLGDHWAKLNGDAIGFAGCDVALARKQVAS